MLKHLKKIFNAVEKEPEMVQETMQAPTLVDNTAELATVQAAFSALQEQFTTLTASYAEAQAALQSSSDAQAAMAVAALLKRDEQRAIQMTATVGTLKAPKVLASLKDADDATFATVLEAMAASYDKEAESAMFSEIGVATDAAVVEEKPVHFNTFIKK